MSSAFTHSQLGCFADCPRRYLHSYEERLDPLIKTMSLWTGTLVHGGVEYLRRGATVEAACEAVRTLAGDVPPMSDASDALLVALAATAAYAARWTDRLDYIAVEEEFGIRFVAGIPLNGKVDAVERRSDGLWIHETKTVSRIDGTFIDRLWIDSQVHTYARAVTLKHGMPVRGFVYDTITKPSIDHQKIEESEEAFAIRYAEACAKNKGGKSTAKRQLAQPDDEFSARLGAWYAERGDSALQRIEVPFDPSMVDEAIREAKCRALDVIRARKRTAKFGVSAWPKDTRRCFDYFRACAFLPLCKMHGGDEVLKANLYRVREDANPELAKPQEE